MSRGSSGRSRPAILHRQPHSAQGVCLHGVTQRSIKAALEWALPPRPPLHWPLGWGEREAGKGEHCEQLCSLLTLCQALPSLGAFLLLLSSASLEAAPRNQCGVVHLERRGQAPCRSRKGEELAGALPPPEGRQPAPPAPPGEDFRPLERQEGRWALL